MVAASWPAAFRRNAVNSICVALCVIGSLFVIPVHGQENNNGAPARDQASSANAQAKAIVDSYFPGELVDSDSPGARQSCAGIYDFGADGSPRTIFAVYPATEHGIRGEMWVFTGDEVGHYARRRIGSVQLDFSGIGCSISFIDLGGIEGRAIKVSLSGNSPTTGDYVFKWDGAELNIVAPTITRHNWVVPALSNLWFVHLFTDTAPALISNDGNPSVNTEDPLSVYRLVDGRYQYFAHGVYERSFFCGRRDCDVTDDDFSVAPGTSGPYSLQIGNGESSGGLRVSGARIVVNGVKVEDVSTLNNGTSAASYSLTNVVVGRNTINVSLELPSDGRLGKIYILIEDHPADSITP